MQEVMTDYQFKSIVNMILEIVKSSEDKTEAIKKLEKFVKENKSEE